MTSGLNGAGPKFALEAIQTGDAELFWRSLAEGNFKTVSKVMARYATQCPADWGDPKRAKTYSELPFGVFQEVLYQFHEQLKDVRDAVDTEPVEGLVFNVSGIQAGEVQDVIQAANENRMLRVAGFMAKFAVSCPEEWGPPDAPATYVDPDFRRYVLAQYWFNEALDDVSKNWKKRF